MHEGLESEDESILSGGSDLLMLTVSVFHPKLSPIPFFKRVTTLQRKRRSVVITNSLSHQLRCSIIIRPVICLFGHLPEVLKLRLQLLHHGLGSVKASCSLQHVKPLQEIRHDWNLGFRRWTDTKSRCKLIDCVKRPTFKLVRCS